ncbi:MAG: dienelactone hydrolase family protein [Rhodospirillaceae bacterium]
MRREDIRIPSRDGGEFDCYVVTPDGTEKTAAIVLASAVHGVDEDVRAIADVFAEHGYIAAAPDLFWRTVPGPLPRGDERSTSRSQPRPEKIKTGEADMADTLAYIRTHPRFNGRAASMGFCYGGPYAVLGPGRLGYDAGISCHGTRMLDYIGELERTTKPVCILWGDQDNQAPAGVLSAYRALAARNEAVALHIFPGVQHGYTMRGSPAFDRKAYDFSMERALAVMKQLSEKR